MAGFTLGGEPHRLMGWVLIIYCSQVVTADGQLLTANAEEHLLWDYAVGQLGVVVSLEYRLHPHDRRDAMLGKLEPCYAV